MDQILSVCHSGTICKSLVAIPLVSSCALPAVEWIKLMPSPSCFSASFSLKSQTQNPTQTSKKKKK